MKHEISGVNTRTLQQTNCNEREIVYSNICYEIQIEAVIGVAKH